MPVNTSQPMLRWAYLPECIDPPEGWSVERFTKIAKVIAGQSPPSNTYNDKNRGLPFLQGNGDFSLLNPKPTLWCSTTLKTARKGDTLISVRAPVGEVNRADQDYVVGRGLAVVRAAGCDADFLHYGIQRWRWSLQRVAQGTTFDAVTARHFAQLWVALPSDPKEQAGIARLLTAVDTAIERSHRAIERVRALRRAVMSTMLPPWIGFRHLSDAERPAGVSEIARADVVCDVCNGSTPPRAEGRYWRRGTIPWLATGKVHDRVIRKADEFVTEAALRECSIRLLPKGTVLVGMIGQGRTRGMCAFLDVDACINQNFGAFTPKPEATRRILAKWLFYYFDFHYSRLREVGGGTNQGALNCYLLKRIRLPLPLFERQKEIAELLDGIEALERATHENLASQHRLKASLLHALFTGRIRAGEFCKWQPYERIRLRRTADPYLALRRSGKPVQGWRAGLELPG